MKKLILSGVIITILAIFLLATPPACDGGTFTMIDDFGRAVTIKENPERIVSLSPTNTEILFAIGAGNNVFGVTEYCNYPEEVKNRSIIGGITTVDVDAVVSLKPDLVIACSLNGKDTVEALESRDIEIFVLDNPETIQGILDNILIIGIASGEEKHAIDIVRDLRGRIDEVTGQTALIPEDDRPGVFRPCGGYWTCGSDTFMNEVISIAGGRNIASHRFSGWAQMELEDIVEENPQVILCPVFGGESFAYDEVMADEGLSGVDAISNDRVYRLDSDLLCRAGPRIVDTIEMINGCLYGV